MNDWDTDLELDELKDLLLEKQATRNEKEWLKS